MQTYSQDDAETNSVIPDPKTATRKILFLRTLSDFNRIIAHCITLIAHDMLINIHTDTQLPCVKQFFTVKATFPSHHNLLKTKV